MNSPAGGHKPGVRDCAALLLLLLTAGCGGGGGGGTVVDFSVTGTLTYEDRLYGPKADATPLPYGFTGTEPKPIRYATVQLVDEGGQVLATAASDGTGHYAIAAQAVAGRTLYVRVLAGTDAGAGIDVSIRDLSNNVTAASKAFRVAAGANGLDATVEIATAAGAFNALDVYTAAAEFVHLLTGAYPAPLKAFWQPGNAKGTYFCPIAIATALCSQGRGIYILSVTGGDTDEFDDDVLWHEYGHFLESVAGALDSPGGPHELGATGLDLRLAWSEGWSDYFSGAIKQWLAETSHGTRSTTIPASAYLDTEGDGARLFYNFANVPDGSTSERYATSETSIAKLLWDINGQYAHSAIWDVLSGHLPSAADPSSLETFWDGWLTVRTPSPEEQADVLGKLGARLIDYSPDGYEPGDDASDTARAVYAETETHNLYRDGGAGEVDIVPFVVVNGQAYRVETFDLRSGTDTYLRVLLPDGSEVGKNDNWDGTTYSAASGPLNIHDGCKLASRVEFTDSGAGTYFAEVRRNPALPKAAGRYGEYKLKISGAASDTDLPPTECGS